MQLGPPGRPADTQQQSGKALETPLCPHFLRLLPQTVWLSSASTPSFRSPLPLIFQAENHPVVAQSPTTQLPPFEQEPDVPVCHSQSGRCFRDTVHFAVHWMGLYPITAIMSTCHSRSCLGCGGGSCGCAINGIQPASEHPWYRLHHPTRVCGGMVLWDLAGGTPMSFRRCQRND